MALIEQLNPGPAVVAVPEVDERAARRTLRDQIARLERELASACLGACPRIDPGPPPRALAAGPRLLTLGELERVRDALAGRLAHVREEADAQLLRQAEAHALLERMLADPSAYKWVRVSNAQLGEPGCKHFHVRPRLGPIGLLAGWWHVKVSSGCPLAWGP
jgi:DNA-binding SARP family transcriptional activator